MPVNIAINSQHQWGRHQPQPQKSGALPQSTRLKIAKDIDTPLVSKCEA